MKVATCCLCVLLLTEFIDSRLFRVKTKANGTVTNDIRDHGMDTQDLEFKFVAKRVEKVM